MAIYYTTLFIDNYSPRNTKSSTNCGASISLGPVLLQYLPFKTSELIRKFKKSQSSYKIYVHVSQSSTFNMQLQDLCSRATAWYT